jgi:hypothetical protein
LIIGGSVILIGVIILLIFHQMRWYTLAVTVTLGEKQLQPNADVQIIDARYGIPVAFCRTDSNGIVSFSLPEGTYLVKASYRSFTAQLSPHQGQSFIVLKNNQTLHVPLRGGI